MRIIIVPGSRAKIPRLLAWPARALYRVLGVDTSAEDDEWPLRLKEYLERRGEHDVQVFWWDGGVTRRRSLEPAARELARMLEQSEEETALFCKSLGGTVGEIAASSSRARVVRIVCVATPRGPGSPVLDPRIELIDVTSPADRYLRLGNLVLHGRKRAPIPGARAVTLPGLAHSDFNKDLTVRMDGRASSLYGLYALLLREGAQRKVYERKARERTHAPRRRPRASRPREVQGRPR